MSWRTIEIERLYVDPAHQPDWTADDLPTGKPEVIHWLNEQLDELERRVRAERERELEPYVPVIARTMLGWLRTARPRLMSKLAIAREMKPKVRVNEIVERERLAEIREDGEAEPGRPASGVDWDTPTAFAARDIWRIRRVIAPRFKLKAAKPGGWLTNKVLAVVAADRQNARLAKIAVARKAAELPDRKQAKVTADAALHWYEKQRLAKL